MEDVIIKRSLNIKVKVGVKHKTWDISITGEPADEEKILEQIDAIHLKLKNRYDV